MLGPSPLPVLRAGRQAPSDARVDPALAVALRPNAEDLRVPWVTLAGKKAVDDAVRGPSCARLLGVGRSSRGVSASSK